MASPALVLTSDPTEFASRAAEYLAERETDVAVSDRPDALVDERLHARGWLVWDDGGPVSLVGVNPPVAGAVRIGPVYTPPEHRGHGYASAAVAAASHRALVRRRRAWGT